MGALTGLIIILGCSAAVAILFALWLHTKKGKEWLATSNNNANNILIDIISLHCPVGCGFCGHDTRCPQEEAVGIQEDGTQFLASRHQLYRAAEIQLHRHAPEHDEL